MKKFSPQGFASLEALLIVVILSILAGTGFYVYKANKNSSDTLDSATKSAQSQPAEVTHNRSAEQKELVIKEWGVKIKLSKETAGAYYRDDTLAPTETPYTHIQVFAPLADAITGPAGKSCKGEYIAIMTRLKKDDPLWNDPQYIGASSAKASVGNYSYNIATKKQYGPECFGKDNEQGYQADMVTANKFKSIADKLVEDFKTIQAAK
jgi:hypothetical protein